MSFSNKIPWIIELHKLPIFKTYFNQTCFKLLEQLSINKPISITTPKKHLHINQSIRQLINSSSHHKHLSMNNRDVRSPKCSESYLLDKIKFYNLPFIRYAIYPVELNYACNRKLKHLVRFVLRIRI